MTNAKIVAIAAASVLAAALAGCTGEASLTTVPPPTTDVATGTLTVHWTIDRGMDSGVCSNLRVDSLELVVYDASGQQFTSANYVCEDFALSIALPEGVYTADATLVGANNQSRSTTLPLNSIDIRAGTDLAIDIDFPSSDIR